MVDPFEALFIEFFDDMIEETLLLRAAFDFSLLLMVSDLTRDEFRLGETRGVDLLPISFPTKKLSDLLLTTTTTFLSLFFFSEELGEDVLENTGLPDGLLPPLEHPESHRLLDFGEIKLVEGMVVA